MMISTFMLAPWVSRRYFKEPIVAMFSIIFISIFSTYMYTSIGSEIHKLDNESIDSLKRYNISFNKDLPFVSELLQSKYVIPANIIRLFKVSLILNKTIYCYGH